MTFFDPPRPPLRHAWLKPRPRARPRADQPNLVLLLLVSLLRLLSCISVASCFVKAAFRVSPTAAAARTYMSSMDKDMLSKRAKRRMRAPPSQLKSWMDVLNATEGGLRLLLDLDNNADALPQLEVAQTRGLLDGFHVLGFAGVDFSGSIPAWVQLHQCRVRTKNGADFVLAFEAGRMLERLRQEGSRDGQGGERAMPVAVIVSADAGMEIVADLMREEGMSCHVIKTLADIRTVCQALSLL